VWELEEKFPVTSLVALYFTIAGDTVGNKVLALITSCPLIANFQEFRERLIITLAKRYAATL
jgi:hypothetical protein